MKSRKESCIKVNTREFDKVLSTKYLSYIHQLVGLYKTLEIWDEEEKAVKSEEEANKLVPQRLHKQIHVFGKEASEKISIEKMQDHTIEVKKGICAKVYPLLRKEREEVHKFIEEQLRKEYIRLSKSSQITSVFFVEKKDIRSI